MPCRAMRRVMGHLPEEDLELYCLGRATNGQLAPIEEHLLECPECVARAEAMLEVIDSLRAALWRLERDKHRSGGGAS